MFDKIQEYAWILVGAIPWMGYNHRRIDRLEKEDTDLKVAVARIDENVKFLREQHERKDNESA